MSSTAVLIEELLQFGINNGMMEELDRPQVRNQLLALLKIDEPAEVVEYTYNEEYPVTLLNKLIDDAIERGIISDSMSERDILDAKIMAQLLPRQSELYFKYNSIKESAGIEAASSFYYNLSKLSNYIRTDRIARNRYWRSETSSGELEITINLSKPEKDPKDIAKAGKMKQSNYPKCLLCIENVGYEGHVNHPARTSHRVLPITLNNEEWYYQYSPYVYYNEHAIIFKSKHEPMKISRETFIRLTDFVEEMPHYFIGSNADLPIVGGSILSHDHFQGGNHRFPMVDSRVLKSFTSEKFPEMNISIVEWPMSVIRVSSPNKSDLVEYAEGMLKLWREYSDESVGIFAHSDIDGESVPHNTITPIARKNDDGLFELDLVLRNNRCDVDHPDGIYHPHKNLHHIKKENIGLIEVMGLAILPARIDTDLNNLSLVLQGERELSYVEESMGNHYEWFKEIYNRQDGTLNSEDAYKVLQDAVGERFAEVLTCAGVYKLDDSGLKAFENFVLTTGVSIK